MGGVVGREEKCMHACMHRGESGIGLGEVRKLVVFVEYLRICLIRTYLVDICVFAFSIRLIFV